MKGKQEHRLKFVKNGTAAKCSCGKYEVRFTGQTCGELQKQWKKHCKKEGGEK